MWGSKKGASKRIDSLVGKSTKIMGDLDFTGGLLVDGKVMGKFSAQGAHSHSFKSIKQKFGLTSGVYLMRISNGATTVDKQMFIW